MLDSEIYRFNFKNFTNLSRDGAKSLYKKIIVYENDNIWQCGTSQRDTQRGISFPSKNTSTVFFRLRQATLFY